MPMAMHGPLAAVQSRVSIERDTRQNENPNRPSHDRADAGAGGGGTAAAGFTIAAGSAACPDLSSRVRFFRLPPPPLWLTRWDGGGPRAAAAAGSASSEYWLAYETTAWSASVSLGGTGAAASSSAHRCGRGGGS
jgi:hypothetical protein